MLAVEKGMREGTGWQKELEDLRAAKTDGIRWQEPTAVMAGAWSGMAEVVVKRKEEEEKARSPEPTAAHEEGEDVLGTMQGLQEMSNSMSRGYRHV